MENVSCVVSCITALQMVIASFMLLIILEYGLDLSRPYPQWTIEVFDEPLVRFTIYVTIYVLACWSPLVSILLATMIVFLHLDHINLAKKRSLFS